MRWVRRLLVALLLVTVVAGAFGFYTVRRSFPQTEGRLEVSGLHQEVEVRRDRLGVPHLYAATQHDLFFAQGYVHAQDRFWQMDFWRHIGAARLSEMFGESQLETDVFLRSLGWERIAEEEWAHMESPAREILQSYADGVNAYLAGRSKEDVSLEYAVLSLQNSGYEIEPWTPVNTLTWVKVMAWDLGGNMGAEISRAILGERLGAERVSQLFPAHPDDRPVIVEGDGATVSESSALIPDGALIALSSSARAAARVSDLTSGRFEDIGSNSWVVSGELTESGAPMLANDTHLGIQMPSIWYSNGLHCTGERDECPFQVVGFSFPGAPGVVIGHNGHHAWGVTNEAADTQDLFIEQVDPDDPSRYRADREWVEFDQRTEVISVAGGEAVSHIVRSTRHGPVISGTYLEEDAFDGFAALETPEEYVVSLSWRALEPSRVVEAILGVNLARSQEEFREVLRYWDVAPQNVVYADVEGNIAYYSTGEIPVRGNGDGRLPAPGWDSAHDWRGYIPFDEMPGLVNPEAGFIVTANNPVQREGVAPLVGTDAAYGYRASRIAELVAEGVLHDVSTMQAMQVDSHDHGASQVVPYLLDLPTTEGSDLDHLADLLASWADEGMEVTADSAGAAAYQVVWRNLLALTFHDELPEEEWPEGGERWFEVVRLLLTHSEDQWWDQSSTEQVETRDDILSAALGAAHSELEDLLGDDPARWSWGRLHVAEFEHQTLGRSGIGPIEWLFNRTAPPVGGSASLVNAVGWNAADSYRVDWLPSERMVIDLGDLDSSTFAHTTGQSGHAFHDDYDSMLPMWAAGEQAPMPWSRAEVERLTEVVLTLAPAG